MSLPELKKELALINKLKGFNDAVRSFHKLFEKEYGYDYSDVDDDELIESIDYDGNIKWKEFIKHMEGKQCGM